MVVEKEISLPQKVELHHRTHEVFVFSNWRKSEMTFLQYRRQFYQILSRAVTNQHLKFLK